MKKIIVQKCAKQSHFNFNCFKKLVQEISELE